MENKTYCVLESNFILRVAVGVILTIHCVVGLYNGGITNFGNNYLNEIGFAPLGVPLAWAIKLSHIACTISLFWTEFLKPMAWLTIFILIAGIIIVHLPDGWFVVGAGRNGVEFNVLLIASLLTILYPNIYIIIKPKSA